MGGRTGPPRQTEIPDPAGAGTNTTPVPGAPTDPAGIPGQDASVTSLDPNLSTLVPIPTMSVDTVCVSKYLAFGDSAPHPASEVYSFSSEYYETATRIAAFPGMMECAWVTEIPKTLDPLLSQYLQETLNWLIDPTAMAAGMALFTECPTTFALPEWNFRLGCPAEWNKYVSLLAERTPNSQRGAAVSMKPSYAVSFAVLMATAMGLGYF
ncbi:unnamed protein product [Parascedosporium putredinis]|uniref:Uncharacterized protein n=1 Tax=Parascedosporium putredinis TaxID=1442378 RepID=A0A9P1GXA6_9PEZI|nr:unnamed protein product [Parascedosporium putredinis]CAI7989634.1 unnamed protein product [Parascedosporium putredinis]